LNAQWREAALFRPVRSPARSRWIADQLRRRIVTGDLMPGQRLPSVRKLASLFDVSIPTIESALHALVALGMVRTSPGVGSFVTFSRERLPLLTYVWQTATPWELALVRAATDTWAGPLAAAEVRSRPPNRAPKTLADVNFLVHERSIRRVGLPRHFLEADLAFHRTLAASLRGVEIAPVLYRLIGERLIEPLMAVADVQAADHRLDDAHLRLAAVVLAGDVPAAARCARDVAFAELRAMQATLG
jgi:GntR family transcriptional repressor for pyruvate dehydrogenase complex